MKSQSLAQISCILIFFLPRVEGAKRRSRFSSSPPPSVQIPSFDTIFLNVCSTSILLPFFQTSCMYSYYVRT